MNLITGSSGIGKSTLLREYLPQHFEHYLYIDQKPLLGNKNSSVATALNVSVNIFKLFAIKHHKDHHFFSNQTGCEGTCPICKGVGYIDYRNGYNSKIQLLCKDCAGTGFNKILKKYNINSKNIFDIWDMTIDEAINYFTGIDKKITKHLEDASSLLLGHLKIGQPVSTLSGGENIRVKLLKAIKSTVKVFGVDEPFKGLNRTEILCIVQYFNGFCQKDRTVIVIDQSDTIEQYFTKHIQLIYDKGILRDLKKL